MPKVKLGREVLAKAKVVNPPPVRDEVREMLLSTGNLKVVNRLSKPFQFTYAGTIHTVRDWAVFKKEIAYHAMNKSLVSYDPVSGEHVYRLGIEGDPRAPTTPLSPEYGERKELIDRKNMPQAKDPTTGQPLRVVVAPVPGGAVQREFGGGQVSAIDFQPHPEG